MECSKVREKLAAYLEGAVNEEEGALVRHHLASCGECRAAAEDLRKTADLVRGLEELEPPPWLTQRVMAHVREEAERKRGLLGWFFYPFRVKIPLEAIAMLVVVGLVVYMYKANAPQFQAAKMAAGTGQMLSQERVSSLPATAEHPEGLKAKPVGPSEPVGKGTGPEEAGTVKGHTSIRAPRPGERPSSAPELAKEREEEPPGAAQSPTQEQGAQMGAGVLEALPRPLPPPRSMAQAPEARDQVPPAPIAAAPSRAYQPEVSATDRAKTGLSRQGVAAGSAAEAHLPKYEDNGERRVGRLGFTLRVRDVSAAAQEVEKMLGEAGAPRVVKESREGAESIAAVVGADKVEGLLRKVRGVGEIGDFTPGNEKGNAVAIRIDIVGKGRADEKVIK